jgi:hypothetical protein
VTLYLDESGGKDWPSPWGLNPSQNYVLCGPVMTPEQDLVASKTFEGILERRFPIAFSRPSELHYGDIINGRGHWAGISREERKAATDEVWEAIIQIAPALLGTVVRKRRLKERYGAKAFPPNEYALTATCDRFHRHLTETDSLGMLLMDSETMAAQAAMQKIVMAGRRYGGKIGGVIGDPDNPRHDRILNTLAFVPSHMSAGVQIADFLAYATWSSFERGKSDRHDQIAHLWRSSGTFREPSVVPL